MDHNNNDDDNDAWNASDLDYDQNTTKNLNQLQKTFTKINLDYQKEKDLANLKMSAAFIVAEYVEARSEFINSYETWLRGRKEIILELYQISNELDKWKKGKDVTQAAGSSMGLIGGSLTITGLALMPVTMGVSGTLCAVGLGVGLTGGVTSLSGTIGEILADKKRVKQAQEHMNKDNNATVRIVKAYENLKLCLFEANFILERCQESRDIIQQKLRDLEITNSTFMPQGLIHTMKVEQINTALAASKIEKQLKLQREEQEQEQEQKVEITNNELAEQTESQKIIGKRLSNPQLSHPLEELTDTEYDTALPESPLLPRKPIHDEIFTMTKSLEHDPSTKKDLDRTLNGTTLKTDLNVNSVVLDYGQDQLNNASSSQDISRAQSLFLGTTSSGNGVKEVLSRAVLPSLQFGQSLAVGLSSAFIVVDIYQLLTASRNLNNGSVSETATVLRSKSDQMLEQQLFFNQIYEYIR